MPGRAAAAAARDAAAGNSQAPDERAGGADGKELLKEQASGPLPETEMTVENIKRGVVNVDVLKKRIPLGPAGQGEDVANAVSFMCSEKAFFITGQTLYVDGGYLAFGYW